MATDELLTRTQAARVLNVTTRTLHRYAAADDPLRPAVPGGHGKPTLYDPATVGAWLIRRELIKLQEQAGSSDPIDYHAERARLTSAQADHQELRNAELRRELARVELIQFALADICGHIAATLGTIKGKVKRAQPTLTNASLTEIEMIVTDCQNAAAGIQLDWDAGPVAD